MLLRSFIIETTLAPLQPKPPVYVLVKLGIDGRQRSTTYISLFLDYCQTFTHGYPHFQVE